MHIDINTTFLDLCESRETGKKLKMVMKHAAKQGFGVRKKKSGHVEFKDPEGKGIVVAAGTGFGGRGWGNFISQLKRIGYEHYE